MNIDILNLTKPRKSEGDIDIALPVIAIECEVTPPLENHLDAYEEAVLKLVGIGLSSARGIALALNATESLIAEILENLKIKHYLEKAPRKPWKLTEDGNKRINGIIEERASKNSKFGYMFVNAIKKDILPYFYEGDLNQAPLFNGGQLPFKLTLNESEEKTFGVYTPKKNSLNNAFKKYLNTAKQLTNEETNHEENVDSEEFSDSIAGLDTFDEMDDNIESEENDTSNRKAELSKNTFVRALNCPPKYVYLTMRIRLDTSRPGGYLVKSPFDLNGKDDSYYLWQIQWLSAAGNVYIAGDKLDDFLIREIRHLSPKFQISDKDFSVFVLENMPLLVPYRERFCRIYDDMERIYALMRIQNSLIEKENIVSNVSKCVLERLFNMFFSGLQNDTLINVSNKAIDDLHFYRSKVFKQTVIKNTTLNPERIFWSDKYIEGALLRLKNTGGHSIVEKFINIIVLNYYIGTREMRSFLSAKEAQKMYELADHLNKIRNKVSHDTKELFEVKDYEFYIANVFILINSLLETFKEG